MDLSSDFLSNGGEWAYYDGNMKELWDFNRNSVKSYLFFLIYLQIIRASRRHGKRPSK